jgi:anti-anti-sigma regulatory factor
MDCAMLLDYQLLFDRAPGLFLVLRPDAPTFTILGATDAYLDATHTKREQIVGRGLFEVFPDNPDDPAATGVARLRASLDRVLATGRPDTMAVQHYDVRRPDGSFEERHWSPINSPVHDRAHKLVFILYRVEDVTSLVKAARLPEGTTREGLELEILHRSEELEDARRRLEKIVAELELPVLRTWPAVLTVPLLGSLYHARVDRLQDRVLHAVTSERIRAVLIDFTAVVEMDSVAVRGVGTLCSSLRLVGALPLLCGFRAEVAMQLTDAGLGTLDALVFGTQADALARALEHVGAVIARGPN